MGDPGYKYVFGPALSRRLGRSLGVDVVPFKTCTYDCVYCQLGPTTNHTLERKAYVPLNEVVGEIRRKLDSGVQADYITIGGSGEPTLYSDLGLLIGGIKALTSIPVAVLTNGSLLWEREVRDTLKHADVVLPSLDASDAPSFRAVNRPLDGITFEKVAAGLEVFRQTYTGQIWLEIFLSVPIEAKSPAVDRFIELVKRIYPDRIHLNTLSRPAPGSTAVPVALHVVRAIADRLGPNAEVIAEAPAPASAPARQHVAEDEVLALIRRHPCSIQEIAAGLSTPAEEVLKHVEALLEQGKLTADHHNSIARYIATNRE